MRAASCKRLDGSSRFRSQLLEQWLIAPERSLDELQRRQDCIERFAASPIASSEIQDMLKSVRDIKRILGRVQNRIRNPRELGGIRETLNQLPAIIEALGNVKSTAVDSITRGIDPLPHLAELLNRALKEEMPNSLSDGGYIALGYDEALDEMLSLTTDNKLWLSNLETDERDRTGIKNLKVKFNNAFGYFIEVTKANLNLVPDNYIRKQTMVNGERFVTENLKKKRFSTLKRIVSGEKGTIRRTRRGDFRGFRFSKQTAAALAELDVLLGWTDSLGNGTIANRNSTNPNHWKSIKEDTVVEQMLQQEAVGLSSDQSFVPNDSS